MTERIFVAARSRSLMRSLAALGLVRVLAEQADPDLHCRIMNNDMVIDTSVPNIVEWLVDSYQPRPILSPWNGGSGFGAKDRIPRGKLDELIGYSDSRRVSTLREAVRIVDRLMVTSADWSKKCLIEEIENVCPDEMLPWLRAAVVVVGNNDELVFPPLLGTGGNDGRLDFSSNYHQRMLDVLPLDARRRKASIGWARDLLLGTANEKLVKAAVGQFDPGGAGTPNSSVYGSGSSLVNPWAFILMLEGATLFQSSPARRHAAQANTNARAAMTFMTRGSDAGFRSGNSQEDSRGEVWLPWWGSWLRWSAIQRIFAEGKAVWRGQTATRSGDMYLAVGTAGVSTAIDEFDRFSLVKRNGLAYTAVRADAVRVGFNDLLRVVSMVEDWPLRVDRRMDLPGSITEELRVFGDSRVALAKSTQPNERLALLRTFLGSVTRLEMAVSRSVAIRGDIPPRVSMPGSGNDFLGVLRDAGFFDDLWSNKEFRIALGFASLRVSRRDEKGEAKWRGFREMVTPIETKDGWARWTDSSDATGFEVRPLADILNDLARRIIIEADPSLDSDKGPKNPDGSPKNIDGISMPNSVHVPLSYLHSYVRGDVSDSQIAEWLRVLMVFEWNSVRVPDAMEDEYDGSPHSPVVPDPFLGVLGLLRNGVNTTDVGGRTTMDEIRRGLTPAIMGALVSGNYKRSQELAVRRLSERGIVAVAPPIDGRVAGRVAASLLPMALHWRLARSLAYVPKPFRPEFDTEHRK